MRNFIYIFILINLISCSWLSEPAVPTVDIPQKFNSSNLEYTNVESLPYLAWWGQFNDPQLNILIESGLKNNLDLSIALSNLEQAQGQLLQIQLSWIPLVNLVAGFSSNPALASPGTFYGVWPSYTINIAQLMKQQELASYNIEVIKAMVDGVRLTLIGQISSGYMTLIAQEEQLKLLNQLNNDMNELIQLRHKEIKIGVKDTIDIENLLSDNNLIKAQLAIAQHNILLSNNSLRYILNENPGKIKNSDKFNTLDFLQFKPSELPTTVLQNRPDLKMAEYELKVAHTNVAVSYTNLFPEIKLDDFIGNISKTPTSLGNPDKFATFQDAYVNWGIDPNVFGQIEAGKGAYKGQVYKYIQTVRKILRDVDNSYSANIKYTDSYKNTLLAWKELENKYNLQKRLYEIGIISYPELLESKIKLDNLNLSVNQAHLQQAISLVNLYQELAGGYKYKKNENINK